MFKPAVQPSGELPRVAAVSKGVGPEQGEPLEPRSMWQVDVKDETRLSAKLAALDAERYRLDQAFRGAVDRRRYSSDPDEVARAADEERAYLLELDGLMTRIRGLEGRLLLLHPEGLMLPSLQLRAGV